MQAQLAQYTSHYSSKLQRHLSSTTAYLQMAHTGKTLEEEQYQTARKYIQTQTPEDLDITRKRLPLETECSKKLTWS